MNVIVSMNKDVSLITDFKEKKIVGIIDNDYGLIRYLTKIFNLYECNMVVEKGQNNNLRNCYIQVQNCDLIQDSYLHRIILRYYSQYDMKLEECLNNKEYEVNHKNKLRFDNRIENLEIVTKLGNRQHEFYKPYVSQVAISSEYIKQVQEVLKKEKQYTSDRKYLEKVSNFNWKYIYDYNLGAKDEKFFKCKYIRFSNKKKIDTNITPNYININTLINLEKEIFLYIKSTNFKFLYDEKLYYGFIKDYTKYRYMIITNKYFKILRENIDKNKYRYLKEVLIKFKLLDFNNLPNGFTDFDRLDKNRLINLIYYRFRKGINNNYPYHIYLNNILCTTSIKDELCCVHGKYNSIRTLYFLGLLTRLEKSKLYIENYKKILLEENNNKEFKMPNFFTIPKLTTSLLEKANERAKKLLDTGINKITYFILAENFGVSIADEVYKSNTSKRYYKNKSKVALNKVNLAISSLSKTKIKTKGYIKFEDIFDSINNMNQYRKMFKLEEDETSKEFMEFISTCLNYIPSTKEILEQLDLEVVYLSNEIIENINKYQTENISYKINNNLKPKQKVIVLKRIIK